MGAANVLGILDTDNDSVQSTEMSQSSEQCIANSGECACETCTNTIASASQTSTQNDESTESSNHSSLTHSIINIPELTDAVSDPSETEYETSSTNSNLLIPFNERQQPLASSNAPSPSPSPSISAHSSISMMSYMSFKSIPSMDTVVSTIPLRSNKTNKYESYNRFLLPNRKLVMHGYARKHSNNTISDDLISLFIQFYDHAIVWTIKDYDMDIFNSCYRNKMMQGPTFSPINGLIFSLSICPKAVAVSEFFLILNNMSKYIRNMTIQFNFSIDEIKYQYMCTKTYNVHCRGNNIIWGYEIPCQTFRRLNSLHISCSIDIIHIEYNTLKNFITMIPPLKDAYFKWKFTDDMLANLRNDNWYGQYCSDCFYNSCWSVLCRKKNESIVCALTLLKLPFANKSINIDYQITTYLNDIKFILKGNQYLCYNNGELGDYRTRPKEIFPLKWIHDIHIEQLIFFVSIKVIHTINKKIKVNICWKSGDTVLYENKRYDIIVVLDDKMMIQSDIHSKYLLKSEWHKLRCI